ncbi:hypothetical protein MMC25_002204 [Agyrium rufum]|nr:hypothetical protein [Agyrium rufum]
MSHSYESQQRRNYGASSRRTAFGYWVPLVLTVTVATIGLATWVWKERKDNDDEDDYRRRKDEGRPPPGYGDLGPGQKSFVQGPPGSFPQEDESVVGRMQGALRRTPSPQQIFDGASRRVAAGVAAAGAMVGGALSSIREEDKRDYEDHSRWSEEAAARAGRAAYGPAGPSLSQSQAPMAATARNPGDKRKAVAIVVSAERKHHGHSHEEEVAYIQTHASILSHLPEHIDADSRVFILIYAPDLPQHPLNANSPSSRPAPSISSSYSNIAHEDAQTPSHEQPLSSVEPRPISSPHLELFDALYHEARTIAEKETMIMPFNTPGGYVHLLRHIAPEVVYVQETLAGPNGDAVVHISGWVGQVVLIVGDESGHGGLVDSEDERGHAHERKEKWWHNSSKIGLGKGIEVVESVRVGEDWRRRVRGHD